MTKLQQTSLITYITTHKGNCDCKDCEYFGGVAHLLEIYQPEFFTDNDTRRIYLWLGKQFKEKGTCDFKSLNFNDPTAPKLSDVTQCHIDSYGELEKDKYLTLKEIICNI